MHGEPTVKKRSKAAEPNSDTSHATAAKNAVALAGPAAIILALQRAAGNRAVSQFLQLGTGEQSLDPGMRSTMAARLGHDRWRGIRTDQHAAQAAHSVDAAAFTSGQDVVFGAGQYAPGTPQGERLLEHELTHVVQQARAGASRTELARRSIDRK